MNPEPGVIISGDRQRAQEARAANAARMARALHDSGVRADDCVAIYLRNDFPFFETSAACTLIGAYATPINWHYTAEEAGYILRDCDAKVVVIHSDLLANIRTAIPEGVTVVAVPTPPEIAAAYGVSPPASLPQGVVAYDDFIAGLEPWTDPPPASRGTMIYTSGTTGHPKGVRRDPLDEDAQARQAEQIFEGFGIPADCSAVRTVMTGPMYHSAPNAYGLAAARNGAFIYLQARFDAEDLLRIVQDYRITHMHVVPTMFVRLLRLPEEVRAKYDVSSLVHVIHGAAPCPPEAKRRMIEWWGPVIYEYYGSTENGLVTVVTSKMATEKPGTVGKPISSNHIRILDDDHNDLPPGEIGEVYIWRPNRTDFTYNKRDDARREIDVEGFLTNGDMGWLDEDGCLFLADRKNDMVISGGVNIYPAEIEKALVGMPGVKDCAVFGIPDAEFGEALAAHVERADPSVGEDAVKRYLAQHVARYKIPRTIVFADSLPREDSGKIFKRKLREPYWEGMPRRI
ncbi:MAG: long-chain fatty acid--CoA ligase [Rhizobiales bacterium NRL2]|nr:MAG: long-chain fatty acid--CoA ligase [Rhizobiales bacterium NRL2]